ncbi:MAG: DUF4197 domain-containing protein [Saprospiraceae bacterium]
MALLKRLILCLLVLQLSSCDIKDLNQVLDTVLNDSSVLSNEQIGQGLKEALNLGISKGADRLSVQDGYFKSAYKILLPPEARKVTEKLQNIPGFNQVENIILEKINRGAEDAAKKAKPIFVAAIKQMTFSDVMNILMGEKNAATQFLNRATYDKLYAEFNPVIVNSLDKFKAREYWSKATDTYNKVPFTQKVNPRLDDYVTNQALDGLFAMVAKEELNIRNNVAARTTDLLKKVFAKQDN